MEVVKITRNPIRGRVISVSRDQKTAKVQIPRIVPDRKYGKRLHLNTAVFVDTDGFDGIAVGRDVEVLPCRRISKTKSWKVTTLVARG